LNDELIAKLGKNQRSINFTPATDAVVAGHDLHASGNRHEGDNVYVATRSYGGPPLKQLQLGRRIAASEERYGGCTLRLQLDGGRLSATVIDDQGRALSRTLVAAAGPDGTCDEGQLAWFGPLEDICTPWSDNDPSQCQVVTLERLREFARGHPVRQTTGRARRRIEAALREHLLPGQLEKLKPAHATKIPGPEGEAFGAMLELARMTCPYGQSLAEVVRNGVQKNQPALDAVHAALPESGANDALWEAGVEAGLRFLADYKYRPEEKQRIAEAYTRVVLFLRTCAE
jgi:hypothetical protein